MLGSTFIRIYFHAYVYLFEYFNSRNINITGDITPASMCSCPCCRIIVMIRNKLYSIFIKLNNFCQANYEYILGKYITSGINIDLEYHMV